MTAHIQLPPAPQEPKARQFPEVHRKALERFKAMTPEEQFQTFVDAGIYDQDGVLQPEFGGNANGEQNQ